MKQNQNIAFAIFRYMPFGGVQRTLCAAARALYDLGFTVTIFCDRASGAAPEHCNLVRLPAHGFTNHGRALSFERKFAKAAAGYAVKVGFNRMAGLDIYYAGDDCLAARCAEKPAWRNLLPRNRVFLQLEHSVIAPGGAALILTLTDRQERDYQEFYGAETERFRRLSPNVNARFRTVDRSADNRQRLRKSFDVEPDEFLLVQVAASFRTKGVDRVLDLLDNDAFRGKKIRYLVAGGDARLPQFRREAERRALPVTFLGATDRIPELLTAADLMIHPARAEATGGVLAEALCCALPVLTTDRCGYAPLVRDAHGGVVLGEPYREELWHRELASLIAEPARLAEFRKYLADYYRNDSLYDRPREIAACIADFARSGKGAKA